MNTIIKRFLPLAFLFSLISCDAPGGNENTKVLIKTTAGDITIRLYDGTPLHRDNFIRLVNMGFYDGISFHRVIKDFMIQAGDPLTRSGLTKIQSDSLSTYTIPAEIRKEYYHKKGALAAAREGNDVNPEMRSSGTQFYIVQGKKYTDQDIAAAAERINSNLKQIIFSRLIRQIADSARRAGTPLQESEVQEKASLKMFDYLTSQGDFKFTDEQVNAYKTTGGVPRLDGTYTVFGEVTEGFDVVDKIASVPTDASDKPVTDVKILKIKIVR
ncbi:MAG: peptidylprolyl isomerase [Bacteroidales bacterium]|jgi:cyclophilin family peptidyl-prolyl cis-trans isomerase|nr:peptidylprolyl isomerase [Bacteroidales bacterium]